MLAAAARGGVVVDVGSGTGALGLAAAALGAASVFLTDLPHALPLIVANARRNIRSGLVPQHVDVHVQPLEWCARCGR